MISHGTAPAIESKTVRLKELVSFEYGSSLPSDARVQGSVPVFGSNGQVGSHNTALVKGPGIVVGRKGSIGKTVWVEPDFWPIDTTYFVKTNQEPKFVYYLLSSLGLEKLNRSTGVPGLNREDAYSLKVAVPSIENQRRIAEILTTTDQTIAATRGVINEAEKLRGALLNQLLTLGIGHAKFKQTESGEIPESWKIHLLDDVAQRGTGHTPSKKVPSYYNGGIKWVSLTDSSRLDHGVIVQTDKEISLEGIKNSSAVLHAAGSVILSRDAGVGKSAVLGSDMAVSQHFIVWTCGPLLNNWFLYYYLQYHKPAFERIAAGSTIKTIGMPYFKRLQIGLPPINEQQEIVNILDSVEKKIAINRQILTEQLGLKRGLMQDLLSGKARA